MLQQYNSGDFVHPNDVGYKAMADAIDLTLFTKISPRLNGSEGESSRK